MNNKQTIAKVGLSRDNRNSVNIVIEDGHSGDRILSLSLGLTEYALFSTGLHGVESICEFNEDANIACSREVERISINTFATDKEELRKIVEKDFVKNYLHDGWVLHSDGTNSQQKHGYHQYIIKRYKPVEDPLTIEDKY